MKIVFIGSVEFSESALERLICINANIVGVCTKEESSFNSDFVNLGHICFSKNIPYITTRDINEPSVLRWIKSLNPDVIFCFGWSSLIKRALLNSTPMGVVGFHPAALPRNRGRHPIVWALALGLERTASTFFFMNEGADDGDIISQRDIEISHSDYAQDLYEKITTVALDQLVELHQNLKDGKHIRRRQDDSLANYWRRRNYLDGQIDFRMCSRAIYNLVRALSKPYVGAHLLFRESDVKVWKIEEVKFIQPNLEPGLVLCNKNGVIVKSYDGAVRIIDHEFEELPSPGTYL